MNIYLAEITAYNLTTLAVETLRFCTGTGYIDGSSNYYEPRIEQPALMRRETFADGQIGGASANSLGELVLANGDGGLDGLIGYAFAGRAITLKVGDSAAAYGSFVTRLKAVVDSVGYEYGRISLVLRDRMQDFDKPIQPLRYAGSNSLPNGLEGVDDLKDSQKPLVFGRANNMTPVLVNTSRLIYQVSSGAVAAVVNVFDRGSYLSQGADYTSQADMEANSPAAGTYRVWPAGGCVRLGSSPSGTVTATVWEYWQPENCSAAQIVYRIATGVGSVAPGDTVAADYTTLDGQNAGGIGLVCGADMTIADALNQIAASVGAWWGFDALGRFRVARLDAPAGSPAVTFTAAEILELEIAPATLNGSRMPAWRVGMRADPNWTPQPGSELAGIVPADRRTWLAQGYRLSKAEDATVKTAYPLAQEAEYDSLLAGAGFAAPEAQRRLALFKSARFVATLSVAAEPAMIDLLDLGTVVSLQIARYGMDAGKLMSVIGIETDYRRNRVSLTLWG